MHGAFPTMTPELSVTGGKPMTRSLVDVDQKVAPTVGGAPRSAHPPPSVGSNPRLLTDGDAGSPEDDPMRSEPEDWDGPWGAARLGIP